MIMSMDKDVKTLVIGCTLVALALGYGAASQRWNTDQLRAEFVESIAGAYDEVKADLAALSTPVETVETKDAEEAIPAEQ